MDNFKTVHRLLITSFLFLPLLGVLCTAQSPDSFQKGEDYQDAVVCRFVLTTLLVRANVEVKDQWGQAVTDLSSKDFIVIEDGVRQDIAFLQPKSKTGENQTGIGYELAYAPQNQNFDGKYRRVRIVAKSKGDRKFTVRVDFNFASTSENGVKPGLFFGYYAIAPVAPGK